MVRASCNSGMRSAGSFAVVAPRAPPGVRHRTESVRRQRAFERLFVRREHQVCGFAVSRQRRVDTADFERRSIEVWRLGRTFERPSMIRKSGRRFSERSGATKKLERSRLNRNDCALKRSGENLSRSPSRFERRVSASRIRRRGAVPSSPDRARRRSAGCAKALPSFWNDRPRRIRGRRARRAQSPRAPAPAASTFP